MAPLSETEVLGVWRALSGNSLSEGWRSIELTAIGICRMRAARHSPGNEEAVLVGFANTKIAPVSQLPQGQGFRMERASLGELAGGYEWLAIVRQPVGNLELFAKMIADIAQMLQLSSDCSEETLYQRFIGRVRGWQEFMRKGRDGLSAEAELGLVGELCFLRQLIGEGVLLFSAVGAWKGPQDGLHDFELGIGAVEIKSTMAVDGFPVRIASLDQLDDSQKSPLYLAAMRFANSDSGTTLPEQVAEIRRLLEPDSSSLRLFEQALLMADYLDMHEEVYIRRYLLGEMKIHLVDSSFPRLVPFNISSAIRRAQYELDLSLIDAEDHSVLEVVKQLGVS